MKWAEKVFRLIFAMYIYTFLSSSRSATSWESAKSLKHTILLLLRSCSWVFSRSRTQIKQRLPLNPTFLAICANSNDLFSHSSKLIAPSNTATKFIALLAAWFLPKALDGLNIANASPTNKTFPWKNTAYGEIKSVMTWIKGLFTFVINSAKRGDRFFLARAFWCSQTLGAILLIGIV